MPQGFKKNIKIKLSSVGNELAQEWADGIDGNNGFLPSGVGLEDIDGGFIDFVKNDLKVIVDDVVVPVIFLTSQRWSEFSKTWEFTDEFKDVKLPFITIIRRPDVQPGTSQNGFYNIPGRQNFTYLEVPTFKNGFKGIDMYKVPQPTAVDLTFEVRFFANRVTDLNIQNSKIHIAFNSLQKFMNVKGRPIPIKLVSVVDESTLTDFENRRMFIEVFEMLVQGHILDENDFEVVPAINRSVAITEVEVGRVKRKLK